MGEMKQARRLGVLVLVAGAAWGGVVGWHTLVTVPREKHVAQIAKMLGIRGSYRVLHFSSVIWDQEWVEFQVDPWQMDDVEETLRFLYPKKYPLGSETTRGTPPGWWDPASQPDINEVHIFRNANPDEVDVYLGKKSGRVYLRATMSPM